VKNEIEDFDRIGCLGPHTDRARTAMRPAGSRYQPKGQGVIWDRAPDTRLER
jgi:hypothetical protein